MKFYVQICTLLHAFELHLSALVTLHAVTKPVKLNYKYALAEK